MVDSDDSEFLADSSDDGLAEQEAAVTHAYAQAVAELNRIRDKASVDDHTQGNTADYSLHDVSGIGRYVIPRRTGWKALIDIIHDPVPNIDFSANVYPAFDGIVGDHFQSPHFLDPLDDKYEARSYFSLNPGRRPWEDLRDNVAAVRNFLLESYYANTPDGMTPAKAKAALAEIAAFVGDGLYNNWRFLNVIPNHHPGEPFIDLNLAQAPHGKGAQYIYEKILEQQRHSGWLRPFEKVWELLSGQAHPNWKLPPASETHFTDWGSKDLVADTAPTDLNNELNQAAAQLAAAETALNDIRGRRSLSTMASDLDMIGTQLLYMAQNMQGVAHLSEPVRRDAVTIAKEILRKLKFSLGDVNVVEGLGLKPTDDMATLGALRGVATVYERLLAWARGNNDAAILQHPSVLAATRAIGQLGYIAKFEGMRLARAAGNRSLVVNIGEQLKRVPNAFKTGNTRFGDLLDTVEQGIDAVINRTQEVSVSGAMVGKSVDNRGTSMDVDPTAGMAKQVGADMAARRNAELLTAQQLAAMAAQQRAQQPSQAQPSQQPRSSASAAPGRDRTAQGQPRTQQRTTTSGTTTSASQASANAAQLQDAQRKAANLAATRAQHEQEEQHHHHDDMLRQQQQQQNQQQQQKLQAATKAKAAAAAAAAKIDVNMIKGFQAATSLKGVTGAPITGGKPLDPKAMAATKQQPAKPPTPVVQTPTMEEEKKKNPYVVQPPTTPQPQGRGR